MDEMSVEEKKKAAAAGIAVGPKFEDLVVNSNFHPVVIRKPLREGKVGGNKIPTELQAWVASSTTTTTTEEPVAQASSA
jgi:hypothetical protein